MYIKSMSFTRSDHGTCCGQRPKNGLTMTGAAVCHSLTCGVCGRTCSLSSTAGWGDSEKAELAKQWDSVRNAQAALADSKPRVEADKINDQQEGCGPEREVK
jgi:hypothetical protein